jgi:hypothetical protein
MERQGASGGGIQEVSPAPAVHAQGQTAVLVAALKSAGARSVTCAICIELFFALGERP